jgi:hypothetical protein
MKKAFYVLAMAAAVVAICFSSCKKDENSPSVTTSSITSLTSTSAICGGNITSEGSSAVTARGVCWGTSANPTTADSKTSDGTGTGTFTSTITGLTPGTAYHVRAYATNDQGTAYGADVPFSTSSLIKSVSFWADWAGGTEKWEFTYDANSKITKFDDYWEGALDKTINYDYSVSGQLTLTKGDGSEYGVYQLSSGGFITQDQDGNTYEYDANGFMVKYYEYWDNASHLKYMIENADGNVTRITTYDDDGVTAKKIKEYTFTIGMNIDGIQQTNAIDNEWKQMGNFYGIPSAYLVDYFDYWDPRENPITKYRSTLTYEFDGSNRVTKATKTLTDGTTEVWEYGY